MPQTDWMAELANLNQANKELSLSPQEQFLYQHHLNNLRGSGKVIQPDGRVSTMLQTVIEDDNGKFYNIPTVWDGKALSPPEAQRKAEEIGLDKFPSYNSPDEADARYERMHRFMEADTEAYLSRKPAAPGDR
jgi:hypothetical protein